MDNIYFYDVSGRTFTKVSSFVLTTAGRLSTVTLLTGTATPAAGDQLVRLNDDPINGAMTWKVVVAV